jgi:hypothetical protein
MTIREEVNQDDRREDHTEQNSPDVESTKLQHDSEEETHNLDDHYR